MKDRANLITIYRGYTSDENRDTEEGDSPLQGNSLEVPNAMSKRWYVSQRHPPKSLTKDVVGLCKPYSSSVEVTERGAYFTSRGLDRLMLID